MTPKPDTILVIDDEQMNLDILKEYLEDDGFTPLLAHSGREGLKMLAAHPDVRTILLDRMMPDMDGMAFMEQLRKEPELCTIPVIMQTAASSSNEILEGLRAGVFYYLTKPFEQRVLLNVVRAAVENSHRMPLANAMAKATPHPAFPMMTCCEFSFRTMEEAEHICSTVAHMFPDPSRVLVGLYELAYNAIEHGNLEIDFEEKHQLILEGRLRQEIQRRLKLPEYRNRVVTLRLEKQPEAIEVTITDEGKGFDHRPFMTLDPLNTTRLNGRGIAIARMMSFDDMRYSDKGHSVTCRVHRSPCVTEENRALRVVSIR